MRKCSEELLTEVQQIIEKQGIKTSIEVIGTKGLTGVGKFVMGGIASSVINNAHCPVVAIR